VIFNEKLVFYDFSYTVGVDVLLVEEPSHVECVVLMLKDYS